MKKIKSSDTLAIKTEIVLPNDTNTHNNLMGGRLLHWMDIAAAISAQRLVNSSVITAAVNNVSFQEPVKLGEIVTLYSFVSRAFKTSMEVFVKVYKESPKDGIKKLCNKAYYTFVGLEDNNTPIPCQEVVPETDEEIEKYKGALRRRQLSLVLSGRMSPNEATELKELFTMD